MLQAERMHGRPRTCIYPLLTSSSTLTPHTTARRSPFRWTVEPLRLGLCSHLCENNHYYVSLSMNFRNSLKPSYQALRINITFPIHHFPHVCLQWTVKLEQLYLNLIQVSSVPSFWWTSVRHLLKTQRGEKKKGGKNIIRKAYFGSSFHSYLLPWRT